MPEPADRDFTALTEKISRERGFACAAYKVRCLQRRIAVRMRARAVHTYADYARVLDADPREYDLLLDALTINVTKLFRNWETYAAVAREVIPPLWSLGDRSVRVWSAGCASGEEPYSLGILFHRHAVGVGEPERLGHVSILGTDIDRASLALAERGAYDDPAFTDTPPELRAAYFSAQRPHVIHPEVRRLVRFEHRDLLRGPAPIARFHLITCRNVIIYFDRSGQEAVFDCFYDALLPGGFLVMGRVETLFGRVRDRFVAVDSRERIFRRV
jgi:chemotaxis protein methyltransferase CheR